MIMAGVAVSCLLIGMGIGVAIGYTIGCDVAEWADYERPVPPTPSKDV